MSQVVEECAFGEILIDIFAQIVLDMSAELLNWEFCLKPMTSNVEKKELG